MAASGASVVPGPWGRATDMWGKAAGRCSLQGKPAVLTAILRTELRQTETHTSVRARSTGKGLKRFPKPSTMSSDAKEAKTYNGDKKEDWKAFYDEAVRICRQELGSAGVEWFNGEVEKITGQNLQRVIVRAVTSCR